MKQKQQKSDYCVWIFSLLETSINATVSPVSLNKTKFLRPKNYLCRFNLFKETFGNFNKFVAIGHFAAHADM